MCRSVIPDPRTAYHDLMAVLSRRDDPEARGRIEAELIGAVSALLEEGTPYAGVTIGTITARAGQPRTTFYTYFQDKRDLLIRATDPLADDLFAEVTTWLEELGNREQLHAALAEVLRGYRASNALLRALIEASTYDEVIARYWHDAVGRFIAAASERLADAGAAPEEAHATASALVWMVERVYHQVAAEDGRGDDATLRALTDIWASALRIPA